MHMSVRAPLLSAAFSIVRIWIMIQTCFRSWSWRRAPSAPGGLLHHLEQPPRLASRHRPAHGDSDQVALAAGAVGVVRQQPGGAADELAVGGMFHQPLDLDRDGLLHLAAHDAPGEGARAAALRRAGAGLGRDFRRGRRIRRSLLLTLGLRLALAYAHFCLPPPPVAACFWRSTVLRRAMLRRA